MSRRETEPDAHAGEPLADGGARRVLSRIHEVVITQSDDHYEPPESNVLAVSVIGPDVFLTIAKYEQDATTATMTTVAQVVIPLRDLFVAIQGPTAQAGWLGTFMVAQEVAPDA